MTKLEKKYVTVLTPLDESTIFTNCQCLAVYPESGLWQPCFVERGIRISEDDEQAMLEKGDLREM
jgi:hypothetical protein